MLKTDLSKWMPEWKPIQYNYIKTVDEAKAFLKALHDNGEAYHPDDSAASIINGRTGKRAFNISEAKMLDRLMEEVHLLMPDPSAYLLELEGYKIDANQYGYKAGCQTPAATMAALETLAKEFPMLSFVDTSWHNDATDSLEVSNIKIQLPEGAGRGLEVNRFRIWMPNREEDATLDHYTIEEEDGSEECTQKDYDNLTKLIAGIKVAILPCLGETKVLPEIEDEDERMITVDGEETSIWAFIHDNSAPSAGKLEYVDIATLCGLVIGEELKLYGDTGNVTTIKRTK